MKGLGLVTRALSCFLLVFATWNPLGYSYIHWLFSADGSHLSAKALAGAFLLGCYIVYLRVTWLALRVWRTLVILGVMLTGYLAMRRAGMLDPDAPFWSSYVVLILTGTVLTIGICWAHVKRRMTGQSQVLSPPP
ncbi:DUF6524 family protein [Azospirillum agricola]|uniref:DUF6524 family protein n=1 Tax=Azospirillum agricola TaxID=1720247 RepID=UPI000A0F3DD7|nr:DUF6524 family protein [Azospirillum agricola]MBP2229275.1 glucose-6-phosphate-specific signal transduction histidine kinase [Azospirillum agricola]SMH60524.1 hypothetical protein SAMN02982994_5557 [Azospirillum lipoferum]